MLTNTVQLLSLRNASLIQRLSSTLPSPPPSTDTKALTRAVIRHALALLLSIHASTTPQTADKLVNATDARTTTCLLDLLVLEGIYPSLSHGVGIPLERRARNFTLPATAAARNKGRVQEIEENKDVELLGEVVAGLIGVMEGGEKVGRTVRERCLVDVLAGCGELAFMDGREPAEQWKERWGKLIDRYDPLVLPLVLLRIQNMYLQKNPKTIFTTPPSVSSDLHSIIIYHSDKTNPRTP